MFLIFFIFFSENLGSSPVLDGVVRQAVAVVAAADRLGQQLLGPHHSGAEANIVDDVDLHPELRCDPSRCFPSCHIRRPLDHVPLSLVLAVSPVWYDKYLDRHC